jgi:hypothetical protein
MHQNPVVSGRQPFSTSSVERSNARPGDYDGRLTPAQTPNTLLRVKVTRFTDKANGVARRL